MSWDVHAVLSGSSAAGLARLMSDDPPGAIWRPEELAAIFRHQLTIPVEGTSISFGQLLADPLPPIQLLEQARAFAKAAMSQPDIGLPYEAAAAIYYGAIVLALLRCGTRISRLDDASLRRGVQWASQQPWMTPELRDIFGQIDDKLS